MLRIVKVKRTDHTPEMGLWEQDGNVKLLPEALGTDLKVWMSSAREAGVSVAEWLSGHLGELSLWPSIPYEDLESGLVRLLLPVASSEVWACGVTYERSREARNLEAQGHGALYDKVYMAERPEVFLKATPRRMVHPNEALGVRSDSNWMVPEPELGLVLDENGGIVGYTSGNDMSARDIEGENPLYLPQAKVFNRCVSFGPSVVLATDDIDPYQLSIVCRIVRAGETVYEGRASTAALHRKLDELVAYLIRHNDIEDGTVLLTGTCLVPPDDFSLQAGDVVDVEVGPIGVLKNPVVAL